MAKLLVYIIENKNNSLANIPAFSIIYTIPYP